ncbi:MAG: hypothetical protein IPP31_07505 [Chitinophagaceae bacterium]|nr:hypothetical protein [Chitinophagaceae bacterium]
MRLFFIIPALILISLSALSQQPDLLSFEKERAKITKRSMLVLGGYSTANIIVSAFATKTHNTEMRYFHQMNVQWNSINLVLAALGYLGADNNKKGGFRLSSVLKRQQGVEKTYLLNLGLDAAYITTGLYLTERSKSRSNPAKLKGYGNAIMVQGGFLLLYDAVNYAIHLRHGRKLNKFLDNVSIQGAPGGFSLNYRL